LAVPNTFLKIFSSIEKVLILAAGPKKKRSDGEAPREH